MKWQCCSNTILVLVVLIAVYLISGEEAIADFIFGKPANLGSVVNSPYVDASPSLSADDLSLYFCSTRLGKYGNSDLWVTTRPTKAEPWGPPVNLGPIVNGPNWQLNPGISAEGLALLFDCGTEDHSDIWVTTRASVYDPWGTPVKLGPNINLSAKQYCPNISSNGLELYFQSFAPEGFGDADIYVSNRQTVSDPWEPAVNLGPTVNSSFHDSGPFISLHGLVLFFHSDRPGGYGDQDLYMTTRPTKDAPWGPPVNLGPNINTAYGESDACVSADGLMLYFGEHAKARPGGVGGQDLWQVPILLIVDFNGDEIVNFKDFSRLTQYWSQEEPSVDIGPRPFGDHELDFQDIAVLAAYWLNEILPVGLVAYWKLDETEGFVAHDSAVDQNGTLNGSPVWQPAGGTINGALQFDGTDDYVSTPFILNPYNKGPFSIFAWIKGGGLGQVIISQTGGANWLLANPAAGNLMTDLKASGRIIGQALVSQSFIADGNWHRVGLTWDGKNRILYVDDIEVAKDTQSSLPYSTGGLYFGAGKGLEAGSFWYGLIDDVRIYDRPVHP
jgi:hypothetical protein